MDKEKLYFKMYQDKYTTRDTFCTVDEDMMQEQIELSSEFKDEQPMPVFEPVYMTEEAYNELPEFVGY